ncbi:MAG: hypothetical protein KKF44_10135 [Nanoarchaeota archaeon]|nr:hypothetical protein [Nanoarchaeota archaeon]
MQYAYALKGVDPRFENEVKTSIFGFIESPGGPILFSIFKQNYMIIFAHMLLIASTWIAA